MKQILFLILASLTLAACQTTLANQSPEQRAATLQGFRDQCGSFGFSANDPMLALCVQQLALNHDAQVRADTQRRLQAIGRGLQDAGNNISRSATRQPVNCTSTRAGSQVYTNCF